MNTRFLKTLSVRAALVLGGLSALSLAALAQSPTAKASIPFEFAAGGAMMPAGDYTIDVPDLSGVIFLHGASGNSIALLTTSSGAVSTTSSARLVFERRDGMAYLSSVELPGETVQVMSVFKHVTKGAVAAAIH
jgi:hypothetical protein